MEDGELPRGDRAFLADALGTITGGLLGTSTVTSYIESTAHRLLDGLEATTPSPRATASDVPIPMRTAPGTRFAVRTAATAKPLPAVSKGCQRAERSPVPTS